LIRICDDTFDFHDVVVVSGLGECLERESEACTVKELSGKQDGSHGTLLAWDLDTGREHTPEMALIGSKCV